MIVDMEHLVNGIVNLAYLTLTPAKHTSTIILARPDQLESIPGVYLVEGKVGCVVLELKSGSRAMSLKTTS